MIDDKNVELKTSIKLLLTDVAVWDKIRWQLIAACLYKNYLEAFDENKMVNLPDNKESSAGINTDKKKAVNMNQACMSILMTSFTNNPSALSCAVETVDPPNWTFDQSPLTIKAVNNMFIP